LTPEPEPEPEPELDDRDALCCSSTEALWTIGYEDKAQGTYDSILHYHMLLCRRSRATRTLGCCGRDSTLFAEPGEAARMA
jgi:hypothetical protein